MEMLTWYGGEFSSSWGRAGRPFSSRLASRLRAPVSMVVVVTAAAVTAVVVTAAAVTAVVATAAAASIAAEAPGASVAAAACVLHRHLMPAQPWLPARASTPIGRP